MSNPSTIRIDDQEYIRADQATSHADSPIRIVIAQRGWVFIGRYTEDGDTVTLDDASSIRRWGTTGGLGQLALSGKQPNTVLDKIGHVEMHRLGVVASIACDESKWSL